MNRKQIMLFALAAVGCVTAFILYPAEGLGILALPFTLAGDGLRSLSLSGSIGNIAAIVLYVLLGLTPMLLLLGRKRQKEDILLPMTCIVLLYALYYMVNPGLRPAVLANEVGDLIYAGSVYSMLLFWGIAKLMLRCDDADPGQIYQALRLFLVICAAECILIGFGIGLRDLGADISAIQEANTAPGLNLLPTYVFRFFVFAVSAIEYSLDAFVMLLGIRLLQEVEKDAYSEECCAAAEKTAMWCKRAMILIVSAHMLLNLNQVFFASSLHNIDAQFSLPILSIAIVFATMALSRLLRQGKQLKDDNDLFI